MLGTCWRTMPGPLSTTVTRNRSSVLGRCDLDPRQDAGLLAGVQRVVHGLLDGGQQGLAGIVESQQVAVLGEELADGDVPLLAGHLLGGGVPAGRAAGGGRVGGGRRRLVGQAGAVAAAVAAGRLVVRRRQGLRRRLRGVALDEGQSRRVGRAHAPAPVAWGRDRLLPQAGAGFGFELRFRFRHAVHPERTTDRRSGRFVAAASSVTGRMVAA
jgi:hypothetical protein